jgi:hypothetical protein
MTSTPQDGSSAGPAAPHAKLHLFLRPRGRLGRCHVLGGLVRLVRLLHVREERLQAHL